LRTLLVYRDDGPIAMAIGGYRHHLAPSLLCLLAVLPLAVAIAFADPAVGRAAFVLAWFVGIGGLSRGGPLERDRFAWAVPGLLRAGEYGALIWLSPVGALPVLVALAWRHYDVVYAIRYRGAPPMWPTGGWDGRLVLAWLLLAVGWLPGGFYVLGGILLALFVAECVASWLDHDPQGDTTP
jgi:hypothetical protein